MNKLTLLALIAIFIVMGSEYAKADDCDVDDLTDYRAWVDIMPTGGTTWKFIK